MENTTCLNSDSTDLERQEHLIKQLRCMATDADQYKLSGDEWVKVMFDIMVELQLIYQNHGFRHSYSEIYSLVVSLRLEDREVLMENFNAVYNIIEESPQASKHLKKCIRKLGDHISLESMRLGNLEKYSDLIENYSKNMDNFSNAKGQVENELEIAKEQVETLKSKVDGFNTQSVTVLSIFTGIAMSFFGSFELLAGALSNLTNADDFKLVFMVALIGFILFNTIFSLIYAVSKIMNVSIKSSCKYGTCRNNDGKVLCCNPRFDQTTAQEETCGFLGKLIHKYTFVFIVNAILLGVMVVFGICYLTDSRLAMSLSLYK